MEFDFKANGYSEVEVLSVFFPPEVSYTKKIYGRQVCEHNKTMWIHIKRGKSNREEVLFNVSVNAKKHGMWWDIHCCGLSSQELTDNIAQIEQKLIDAFESL